MIHRFVLLLFLSILSSPFAFYIRNIGKWRPYGIKHMRMMFSGIVEEMGVVESINKKKDMVTWDGSVSEGFELIVQAKIALEDAYIGCSIAVNGVCLTATALSNSSFTVGLAPETLRRTNLGSLSPGEPINLERALRASDRNSGHFVQGHVDCVGVVSERKKEGESLWMKIQVPRKYMKYIVSKGFICVDGTSLTVCEVYNGERERERRRKRERECVVYLYVSCAYTNMCRSGEKENRRESKYRSGCVSEDG